MNDSGNPPPIYSFKYRMVLSAITHDRKHDILRSMNVRKASYVNGISSVF